MSTIIIKNSSNTGTQPGSLQKGELAINVTDGKVFYGDGAIVKEFTGATIDTSSFATTGSNTFRGTQIISGSTLVSGSVVIAQSVTASSALITSGLTVTGSVNITGSTTQTGNNNLFGNTTLSGSIIISGSTVTPTVQVYGNVTHDGYIRFNPVSTNIDQSISASYIYVSGSTNDLYFTQNGQGYNNTTRLRWLEGNLYTGLLHGGLITTQSSTVYQISSGSGIIVNLNASIPNDPYPTVQYVNWPNLSSSINALSASYDQQFVSINSSGQIFAQGIPYTDGDFNTKITIGVVLHQNRSTINGVQTFPNVAYGWMQRSRDFIKAFGPLKISGYTLSPSSSRGLLLDGGVSWVDGRNYTVDPNNPSYIVEATSITTSKIFRYRQSGSNGWVYDTNAGAGYTVIDPTQYSLNGTLTALSTNNKWSIQRVYYFPNSAAKALYVYYGNAEYDTKSDAIAAITTETFNEAPNTSANALFIGYMLLQKTADFTSATTYEFRSAGLFRGAGGGTGGGGGGGATALTGLTDVNISSPTNGQPLVYDTATTKWINSSSITGSLQGTATTASYVLNAVSASFASTAALAPNYVLNSATSSFVTNAQTSSFTQLSTGSVTASVTPTQFTVRSGSTVEFSVAGTGVNIGSTITDTHTVTGSLNITGSGTIIGALAVGTSSLGSTENTLVVGPPGSGVGEGGQILLQASGGLYTSASMIDTYQNTFRILRGTNAGSDASLFNLNLQTYAITTAGTVNGATPTEMGYLSGVTSNVQTQINNTADNSINVYQSLGSSVKAQAMGLSMTAIATTNTILTGAQSFIRVIPIYLQSAQTLNGIMWYQAVTGSYTAINENRVALYSYSAGTASLVASSTNDANLWSGSYSPGNTFVTKSFSSPYVASAGFYYIGLLAASSATTTTPTMGAGANLVTNNVGLRQLDFTNGALSYGIRATVTSLPGSFIVGTYLNALTQNIPFAAVY